jgi:hypothetical protein
VAKFNFNFAVADSDGKRSSLMHLRRHGSQIYLMTQSMGGIQKYSFHTPDICRLAFTKEYATKQQMKNRGIIEWRRGPTPEAGSVNATRVLRLHVGTNVLSARYPETAEGFEKIAAAPRNWSTIVDLGYTRDPESIIRKKVGESATDYNHTLVAYEQLENGEAIFLSSHWASVANDTLNMPAPKPGVGAVFGHLVVSPNDPQNSGRPIRVTVWSNPGYGDLLDAWEFGAYPVEG